MPNPEEQTRGEVRLVAMRVAGTYGKGGLRLVTDAGSGREAWEQGITEEEARALATLTEHTWNCSPETEEAIKRGYDKLHAIGFPPPPQEGTRND